MEKFITTSTKEKRPFFLYYASHHTHYPQFASKQYTGQSLRGPFGDSLMELDGSVGAIVHTLRENGVENNTLILFTSDNGILGIAKIKGEGLEPKNARDCKNRKSPFRGGERERLYAGLVKCPLAGITHQMASTLDFLPTIAALTKTNLPPVPLDGYDIQSVLFNKGPVNYPYDPVEKIGVFAVRYGRYKAHFYTQDEEGKTYKKNIIFCMGCNALGVVIHLLPTRHDPPLLFDLETDPAENYNLSSDPSYKHILEKIQAEKKKFDSEMRFGESQMNLGWDSTLEPCCDPTCQPKPSCCKCPTSRPEKIASRV
uniref:Sulfatase N-terminal domain-containing protein n=1 Tax=Latimeria chalumnae TaxID=7897 RepID=H3AB57_LATCH